MSASSQRADVQAFSGAASDSWRTWLMTGARRLPIDRRRVRGAHKGLKRMLVEGMSFGGGRPHSWTKFSGAMVRQGIDDGVRTLPPEQRELIKLAYFGGLSNREIAQRLGITVSKVERGLHQAIARVSEYVERGRAAGRRAVYAIAIFFLGRSLADAVRPASGRTAGQLVKVAAIATVAATAGAVTAVQPAAPAPLIEIEKGGVPTIVSAQPYALLQHRIAELPTATYVVVEHAKSSPPAIGAGGVQAAPLPAALPALTLPIPVDLPPIPTIPSLSIHGLPGA
jgi:DNA-directed RNA polymerase specialized sigma24 family protein